ncbi:Rha family transcriptional regulator [Sedimentibacter sp.]|uniref:Rha family transcriptional regulator n=1 Tax=Sedimentibacter sp. TaxID=1960295 RepID=UPI0028A71EBB|nr:Rha family transcriptional regulator [Sedimentibacter sp.]
MNDLQITGIKTIDSRDIAEMLGKEHKELLKEIEGRKDGKNVGIIPTLEKGSFHLSDYFIPSTYTVSNNKRKYPCYLITKMGCEILGNKQQGEKGILFTAKYVKRFNEMEQLPKVPVVPTSIEDIMIASLQEMKNVKLKIEEQGKAIEQTNDKIKGIQDAVVVDTQNWRKWVTESINKLAQSEIIIEELGDLRYQKLRVNTYKELETRAGCDLRVRVKRLKERLEKAGATKKVIKETGNIDVIEQDKKLKAIYTTIIRDMLVKYQSI